LCAFRKRDQRSREAGFKYFILGSFAAGLFLMGTAYLYGATGSFNFSEFALQNSTPLFLLGGVFLLAALSFKSALFPFHNWLPDVYEGAPSAVTGFMASAVKMAVFGVLIALVYEAKFLSAQEWQAPLKLFIVVSMTLANLAALKQRSVKRMLAYSSIAHVAYTFVALLSSTGDAAGFAVRAVLFYVVVYGFASLGIFAVLAYLDDEERTPFYFEKLNGLASKQPFVALSLALLLTSLAGIPPAAGFIGKFYLFSAALQSHHMDLVIAAIINSLISIYYYAKPVVGMYMLPASTSVTSSNATDQPMAMAIKIVIGICLLMTLLYGIAPSLLFRLTGSL
jgi:NADH-quinone oxidoreductase subunit N